MSIDSPVGIMAKMSTIKYLWLAWKHKVLGRHYWIDNSWLYPSPSNGFHCGSQCLFCGKKIYALSGIGWFDEEDKCVDQ